MKIPFRRQPEQRSDFAPLDFDQFSKYFTFNGAGYPINGIVQQSLQNGREPIGPGFTGYTAGAYKSNSVIFSCVLARLLLFSEARFQYQQMTGGRPGNLFGDQSLSVLERPWAGATTGDLLARAEQFASLAGNAFIARPYRRIDGRITTVREDTLRMLRPDWTTIVAASRRLPDAPGWADDAEVIGYSYQPGGQAGSEDPVIFDRTEVAHYAPIPDPDARWRGMSWITPLITEVEADSAATRHKRKFFENGATPNFAVITQLTDPEKFEKFVELFRLKNEGVDNAYKTMILSAGADVKPVGADLRQVEFKVTQGAGETRIAAAAGVPPVIVGLSEGLQAATYSNYGQARRRFADGTMRPLWRNMAGSLETIVPPPGNSSRLWYDDRDVAFLKEDRKDDAEIQQAQAAAINQLVTAGYEPMSVIDAVGSGDLARLTHTGLFSVQLQPPGTGGGNANGNGNGNGKGARDAIDQLVLSLTQE